MVYGVSPAYTISLYGDQFTASEMAESITQLPVLGFSGYQPEVYRADELDPWITRGAKEVAAAGVAAGLLPTQFVAHFLLHFFSDSGVLGSASGVDEFAGVCEVCDQFPEIDVITVPLGPFRDNGVAYSKCYSALVDKLGRIGEIARRKNYRVALEVLPGSLVGGPAGIAPLIAELGGKPFGYNVDTGHAWASMDDPSWAVERLGEYILGTHLCDNERVKNESRAPGRGTIDWKRLFQALTAVGYGGALDIEIHTSKDRVAEEYRAALTFLQTIQQETTGQD